MKGKLKRIKGHFRKGHQSVLKGKKRIFDTEQRSLKRTYIRVSKRTFDKVKSVPRSVKQFTANDDRPEYSESPMLLRPRKDSSNLEPTNENMHNTSR